MSASDHPGVCPAEALFPDGDDGTGTGTGTDDIVAAARRRFGDGSADAGTIGEVLVHVLAHPLAQRPRIAVAIRDLVPGAAPVAAERLSGWISDPEESPESRGGPGRAPDDMLEYSIALAILDPEARADASRRFRAANAHRAFQVHESYARIGPRQREEAASRLTAEGLARPGGIVVPTMVIARVNALTDLGPDCLPLARGLLDKLFADGATSGAIRQPLTDVPAGFRHEAVTTALRSLTLDPERYLPDRAGTRLLRGADRVVAELAALPDYRDQFATALANVSANPPSAPLVRWRAAALLAGVDAEAHERAVALLIGAGIADPEAPAPENEATERVNAAWQRIEERFAAHAPERLDELGPPAKPEEAAHCQRVLGMTDVFTASVARHRFVYVRERDLFYEDVPRMLGHHRKDDGSYDLANMREVSTDARDITYLTRLLAYADELDAINRTI
ncbi:MAG: hypothetical protein ACRDN0_30235 [Trebonia sp.]